MAWRILRRGYFEIYEEKNAASGLWMLAGVCLLFYRKNRADCFVSGFHVKRSGARPAERFVFDDLLCFSIQQTTTHFPNTYRMPFILITVPGTMSGSNDMDVVPVFLFFV